MLLHDCQWATSTMAAYLGYDPYAHRHLTTKVSHPLIFGERPVLMEAAKTALEAVGRQTLTAGARPRAGRYRV